MMTTASTETSTPPRVLLYASSATAEAADRPAGIREGRRRGRTRRSRPCPLPVRLVELELIDRERRMVERRIRAARFPAVKSFDTFDFTAIPSLNKPLVMELARCEYVVARENIIAIGNSGTGKTHACLALGLAACQRGFSVAFTRRRGSSIS